MKSILQSYIDLPSNARRLLLGVFFMNILNGCFFMILNIYLADNGFNDPTIAGFTAWQYLSVLIAGVPFGLYVRRRSIKKMLQLSAISYPLFAGCIVWYADPIYSPILPYFFVGMGLSINVLRMTTIPYLLRTTPEKNHTHAITLNEISNGGATLLAGIMINSIHLFTLKYNSAFISMMLGVLFCLFSFGLFYFIQKDYPEISHSQNSKSNRLEWNKLLEALTPTIFIAIGAGLTIPFLNLYFHHVFDTDHSTFSLISIYSSLLVVIGSFFIPWWKEKLGFEAASKTHIIAIIALIGLASTEFYFPSEIAFYAAALFFIIRQPFMVMAGPLTTQVSMYYVGEGNREMMSALHSLVWSGAWFVSSILFRTMRQEGWAFSSIMWITVLLYIIGASLFATLIKKYKKQLTLSEPI
jgi:MFS family permease